MRGATAQHRLANEIARLVAEGMSRRSISVALQLRESSISEICRELGIKPADGRAMRTRTPKIASLDADTVRMVFEYRDGRLYWRRPGMRPGQAGSLKRDGYRVVRVHGCYLGVHHVVWLIHKGLAAKLLDHINGDRDDNRIENLREATPSLNAANKRCVQGATPFKGVTRHKKNGKFQVSIRGKYVGIFKSAVQAAHVYDTEALRLFGEFAVTNQMLGLIHA